MIRLTESDFYDIISGSVKKLIREFDDSDAHLQQDNDLPDDYNEDDEDDEEVGYEMQQLQKAFQKQNGTYHATSSDGQFQTGDKVIVHSKKGDIHGVIEDFGTNIMTWEEDCDVTYFDKEKGKEMTMISIPLTKIEKVG